MREYRRDRTGYGPNNRIIHYLRAQNAMTAQEVWNWIEQQEWLGYNPAGYGFGTLLDRDNGYIWEWTHSASCD